MYKCYSCGATFSEPKTDYDLVPYGSGYVKHASGESCPYCGGDYDKASVCELCGDSFFEEDSNHNDVCQSCANIVLERFISLYRENFTPFERDIINVELDGKDVV